jgi:hypothetical protein
MDSYLRDAFEAVVCDAKVPEDWYVCLMERIPYYGGPEEGGWWGEDTNLVAYHKCRSEEEARAYMAAVQKLADELTAESRKAFGEQCLRECEWLEARGLDADYLPEPGGETTYDVMVSQGLPQGSRGCRHYS